MLYFLCNIISMFVSLEVRKVLQILNYSTNSSYVRASVQACVRTCVCVYGFHTTILCWYASIHSKHYSYQVKQRQLHPKSC